MTEVIRGVSDLRKNNGKLCTVLDVLWLYFLQCIEVNWKVASCFCMRRKVRAPLE